MRLPAIRNRGQLDRHLMQGVGLVSFCVPWSAPCREQHRILDSLARRFQGTVRIGVVNVDENGEAAREYGIERLPTLVVFQGHREIRRLVGLQSGPVLTEALEDLVAECPTESR